MRVYELLTSIDEIMNHPTFWLIGLLIHCCASTPARETNPVVYAWFPARFGSWNTEGIQWDCLTHLCFRSVVIKADGTLDRPAGNPPRQFVDLAHQHGVMVTVLAWVNKREHSDSYLANFPEATASNLLSNVKENNLDGLNLDDETMGATNSVAQAPNRELVTRFFRILHGTFKQANPAYHISFAAPPVISRADRYGVSWLDLKAIGDVVDAIIPMGYEQNPPSIGWTTNPEPLEGGGKAAWTTNRDLKTMMSDYQQAIGNKHKLLAGVSLKFGGYEWRCRSDQRLAPILAKGAAKSLAECEAQARLHGRRWDQAQQSPWYCYAEGDAFVQGWYNDPAAWQAKLDWLKTQGYGGIGIWVLDGVGDPPERWQCLRAVRSEK